MISQRDKWPLKSHFLYSAKLKLQFQRGRQIVNLRVRLSLRYNILPLVKVKKRLGAYEKVKFQNVRLIRKLSSCISALPIMRFGGGGESDL
jgi:hypothetical protein